MSKSVQKFYLNLANDLVQMFPSAARKFDIESVEKCYNMLDLSYNELIFQTVETKSFDTLKTFDTTNLSNRFVKDGTDMLSIPITQICNLSIKLSHFSKDCKLGKLKHLYKKLLRQILKNLDHFYELSLKSY